MLNRVSISDVNDETDDCRDLAVPLGECTRARPRPILEGCPCLLDRDGLSGPCELAVYGLNEGFCCLFAAAEDGRGGGPIDPGPPLEEPDR